jgi:hypothetical protein
LIKAELEKEQLEAEIRTEVAAEMQVRRCTRVCVGKGGRWDHMQQMSIDEWLAQRRIYRGQQRCRVRVRLWGLMLPSFCGRMDGAEVQTQAAAEMQLKVKHVQSRGAL